MFTMTAVFIVLLVIMSFINAANFISTDRSINGLLDMLEENGGTFAAFGKHGPGQGPGEQGQAQGQDQNGEQGQAQNNKQGQGHEGRGGKFQDDDLGRNFSKETPYETRFFSVTLDNDTSEMTKIDTSRIAVVSQDVAIELAKNAESTGKTSDYIKYENSRYKYRKVALTDETMYVFVDATKRVDAALQFLLISLLVTLAGLILIAIFVYFLSPMMIRPITESYEKQKKFVTNAGHELKTPLAVIKSCNEVVEMEAGSSKWTESISDQVDRMSALIGHMVSLSKMDEAADSLVDLPKEELDFSELFEETLEPFKIMAEQNGLGFSYAIDSNATSLMLKANRAALVELLSILADNAIKYTAPGGDIRFRLQQRGGKVLLTEENPAEDLTPGNQGQLFDRFYRGDQSHTKDEAAGGYGIGLSLAQSIVHAHGGEISANSPDGKTIKFQVQL